MGWAKYYEDNLSILNAKLDFDCNVNRQWTLLESSKDMIVSKSKEPKEIKNARYIFQGANKTNTEQCNNTSESRRSGRNGLELTIIGQSNTHIDHKLQINGWWKSKVKGCWCNSNTSINRNFADNFVREGAVVLRIVA